jgi:hypothetical protein
MTMGTKKKCCHKIKKKGISCKNCPLPKLVEKEVTKLKDKKKKKKKGKKDKG